MALSSVQSIFICSVFRTAGLTPPRLIPEGTAALFVAVELAYQPNYPLREAPSALVAGNDDGAPVNYVEYHVCGGVDGHEHGCSECLDSVAPR